MLIAIATCAAQEDSEDPVSADEIRDIVRETVEDIFNDKIETMVGRISQAGGAQERRAERQCETGTWLPRVEEESFHSVRQSAREASRTVEDIINDNMGRIIGCPREKLVVGERSETGLGGEPSLHQANAHGESWPDLPRVLTSAHDDQRGGESWGVCGQSEPPGWV
jgi:hypothetical protein